MPEQALRSLAQPSARFAGDNGAPDPLVRHALARVIDQTSYVRAVVALCTSRLLMPIVASGDETGHPDPDRHAEMAAVTLQAEGVTHLLAFTGIDSMRAWNPQARPVLCLLDELAATVEPSNASTLLIDVAGPVPFVVEGEVLTQLAAGRALVELDTGDFAWVAAAE
ncbi:SseB family protein [Tessaracoccus caeni]|uniref:SseB family protein n=1 Tax=Tessaracoccus caeni TaxID=3031239 RepID=UPI0023D9E336|nr:SseB family protein [Tessaracoccus caeni]MDF1489843.1 SseB family protein [Tessaracoccus caeni]